jgi:hypothetical protein
VDSQMHEQDPIRVVHWGLDPVGLTAARLVWQRPGLMPVGAIDPTAGRAGKDLGDLMGFGEHMGVPVHPDPAAVLHTAAPDVTIIASDLPLHELAPMVELAMEAGSNVICLAPEMAYPWAVDATLAERLDDMAYAHGVTMLGTGINPGFVLDSLVIALTGCCLDVERIKGARVIDLAPFGPQLLKAEGIGLSPSRYGDRTEQGRVRGHVGFEQSIHLIADALGWPLEKIEQDRQPVIAETRREVAGLRVEPGQVAGVHHVAHGYVDGRVRIMLEHVEHAGPEAEGIATGDFIEIEGQPPIKLAIQPEIDGVKGSAALAVNQIAAVMLSGPGLKSMAEMPLPRAVLGDIRQMADLKGLTVAEALARGWQGSPLERENSIHLNEKGESVQG